MVANPMIHRILFLSNGHGEDLNASLVLKALVKLHPDIEVAALPIVGEGNAYRKLGVPLIGPTQKMPSGGIFYMNPWVLVKDLWSGLIGLTLQQFQALQRHSGRYDLIVAMGDIVPIGFAHLTGRPYVAFLISTSSHYEGRIRIPFLLKLCLRSSRCRQIFTRDNFTAADLHQQGFPNAMFLGCPFMDALTIAGKDLQLLPDQPMIALLPGSRSPEARCNLTLQLQLCQEIAQRRPMQFRAALVPAITESDLREVAATIGWQYEGNGVLTCQNPDITVRCYVDAFADILHACDLAIGMAGTAVEQAVGLGKPVVQIPGEGPQFTYRFAEAQMRLLGPSVTTIGTRPANAQILRQAAQQIIDILQNPDYLKQCWEQGQERVGKIGGSEKIAAQLVQCLSQDPSTTLRTNG